MSRRGNRLSTRKALLLIAIAACCLPYVGRTQTQNAAPSVPLPPMDAKLNPSYYPAAAAKLNLQGRVLVEFNITRKGKVDNVTIVDSDPETVFDSSVRNALKDVKFTVPKDWEDSAAAMHRFRLSYVFKIYPCPTDPCKAPEPHDAADDSMVISIQAGGK